MNLIHQFESWLKKSLFKPLVFTLILINGLVFSWNNAFISKFTAERNNNLIVNSLIQEKAQLQKTLIEVCNAENTPKDKQTEQDPIPKNIDESNTKDIDKRDNKIIEQTQKDAHHVS
ncbi:MAG: hypothetical protein D0531_05775 [Methylococcales bacterium]|nr:MAG: hypothetical protein D0531_05775 [Methylococcales bacterium]